MKQAILKLLNGDEVQYDYIMQKSRQIDIVTARWKIWALLINDFESTEIAKYFKTGNPNILHGLKRLKDPIKTRLEPISAVLMDEIYKSIPKKSKGLVIEELHNRGYTFKKIGDYFHLDAGTVRERMKRAVGVREIETIKKKIVKFR